MDIIPAVLRPTQAATYCGFSVPTFWRFAKNDPTFPRTFKLGENSTAVMRADLDAWLESKKGGHHG
ncbi:helix-turn-helix transcriptional regulator [Kerstersia similis]|uniref:helix-turn-helix transcriptional regulator n=1 Tax=Kerstersia similis TaxID=206505 RepID=UPI0039F09933